jgi:acyl-coenzyme A synthetase/AMP-(fatty) acid ligase
MKTYVFNASELSSLRHLNHEPFRSLIRGSAANPVHASSVLADVSHECTYGEIPGYLEAIQQYLSNSGVRAGDCITLELPNSVCAALTVLAVLDASYSVMLMPPRGMSARAGAHDLATPRFSRWLVSVGAGGPAHANLASPGSFIQIRPNECYDSAASGPAEGSPRLFAKTSGSLGIPKLSVHHFARKLSNILAVLERLRLEPSHRIALPTPIFHAYGLGVGFLPGFLAGASIDFQERANLLRFLEREQDFDPNVAFVTPTFCETLLRARKSARRYRFMVTGGDRTSDSTRARSEAMHGPLINAYGNTEMGLVSAAELSMAPALRSGTVGRPLPKVTFRIVESAVAGTGSEMVGELQIRSEYGFDGYVDLDGNCLHRPDVFDGDWFRTGDLASAGPEGTFRVLGRCDLSMNRNGVLLPFADVEARLRELGDVEEAAVAAGQEDIRGRTLVAFCVMARGSNLSEQELRGQHAKRVPAFAVPDAVRIVDALPKLPNGKLDRRSLAGMALQAFAPLGGVHVNEARGVS